MGDLFFQLIHLGIHHGTLGIGIRSVGCLYGHPFHAVKHSMYLCQGAFHSLYKGETVLCIPSGLIHNGNLCPHLLRDGQACGIISCAVDLVAGA